MGPTVFGQFGPLPPGQFGPLFLPEDTDEQRERAEATRQLANDKFQNFVGEKVFQAGESITAFALKSPVSAPAAELLTELLAPTPLNSGEAEALAAMQLRDAQIRDAKSQLPPVPQLPMHTTDP